MSSIKSFCSRFTLLLVVVATVIILSPRPTGANLPPSSAGVAEVEDFLLMENHRAAAARRMEVYEKANIEKQQFQVEMAKWKSHFQTITDPFEKKLALELKRAETMKWREQMLEKIKKARAAEAEL